MESVDQTFDALGALQFLYQRKDVDPRRIGLIGWSIGGSKVLSALNRIGVQNLYAEKFRFGIAFYPYCLTASGPFIGPLLILIGGADDWTTPRRCITLRDQNMKSEHPLDLNIYPNAVHFFDDPDMGPPRYHGTVENRERSPTRGVTWGYDAAAHGAAKASVRGFLDRQRK
jgi:dienelactone hydrolase